ncbi:MAG: response regulator [Deltaproteobacteria bacterium]|nr:response regulator [Deltaproteobacteria bacterium]
MRDITTRKQAEELLRENEQNYRTLANSGQALVWTAGTDKLCNYFNTVWLDFTGRTIDQEMGNGWAEGVHPDDLEKCLDIYTGAFDRREKFSMEYRLRRRDGEFRWLLDDGCPRYDSRGEFIGYIGHCLDITEHKRAGEERAKLESQFQQAQKMESVGRLAGGVAHDFNNMLGVILGHTEMAMEQVDPTQPLFADLIEIRKAAERSADLTRQLLAFARKQTVAPKVLDLNETVEGTLKMLRRLIGENIDLAWLPQASLWQVKIDPSQIDQILANLCVNARDAINGIGRVTIETGKIHFDEAYCTQNAGFLCGEFVMLTVSDNGCGMDKETKLHIFEPFFTTKDVGQGTGLGLATVYGIIRQNEGFINVYSEPGHGTIFRIYLPRYTGKASQVQKEVPSIPAQRGQETILLVEDEPGILKITSMMLKNQGYSVIEAGTPGEAIRLAREHAGEIHLVLTDVVMPEMNGRDLARNLMSLYPDIRCMFMSGYTADIIANQGIIEEGVNFIQKPFTLKDLSAAVRKALDKN